MAGEKQDINVPLDEWVKQIVRTTVNECVPKIIEEHQKACPINGLKDDIWGNGNPGLKSRMDAAENKIQNLENSKRFVTNNFWAIARPVISWGIIAMIMFLMALYASRQAVKEAELKTYNNRNMISERK